MSLITCLDGLVDIVNNCGDGSRTSGVLYLDDIGLKLQDAADGNDTHESGQAMVANKIAFAQQKLKNDVLTYYNGQQVRNTVLANGVVGYFQENKVAQANTSNQLGGVFIEVNKYPYLEVYIDKVRLWTKDAETFDLKIYDAMTSAELYSQSVTTTAGEYTDVDIDQAFKTNGQKTQLFIAYPLQGVTTYRTNISSKGCGTCLFGATYDGFAYRYGATIPNGDEIKRTNISLGGDTKGMSIVYSLNCSLDNFVCSIKNRLQYPLLYLAAAEIMREIVYSKNQNSTVLIYNGQAQQLLEYYSQEYDMSMVGAFNDNGQKIKRGLLDQIALPNDICFKCKPKVRRRVAIP